ncbi:MAG TPA: transposase [Streptosporangiaceae bacterium]|nr:transposase [Streptosporangiaceae bacterium]
MAGLAGFRRELFWCLHRRGGALFELADAVLTAPGLVPSLPYLSLEPGFRRGHGMVYQALAEGGIDAEALRSLLVAVRPQDWPLVFAIDASTYPRPEAQASPGREWHHHSCPGAHGSDGAAIAGWAFQWLAQMSFAADSWTAPQDQVRVGAGEDGTRQAAAQVIAHSARLRAAGESGIPLYVLDAGYDEAPLTWDLRGHLDQVQVLVRLRNDRVLYRDPPPRIPHKAGRPRIHGSGTDRFECKNPATWGAPDQELALHDDKYGQVSVKSWSGLHPKLFCRGRFEGFPKPPVIKCHVIRVTVTRLPNGRAVPGPLWLWWAGPGAPDLDLIWRAYLHRFDIEHAYRFAKHTLGWDKAALRHPAQVSRWTWLILAAITQLRLARPAAEDHRQRWERRRKPGKLSPGRVRRDFGRLAAMAGTPASPPKPSKPGPGRPKGRTSTPATRHPVIKRAA